MSLGKGDEPGHRKMRFGKWEDRERIDGKEAKSQQAKKGAIEKAGGEGVQED